MHRNYLFLCLFLFSCGASSFNQNDVHNTWPDKSALMDAFRQQDTICVIYGKEDYALTETIIAGIAGLDSRNLQSEILVLRDDKVTEEQIKRYPVYVIGTQKNLLVKRLDENMPVNFTETGFIFDDIKYNDKSDIIKISLYPNVFNPKMPITLLAANSEEYLIEYIKEQFAQSWGYFFWESWGYQIFDNGHRVVLGNFSEDKNTLWSIDKKLHWDFNFVGNKVGENAYIEFYTHDSGVDETNLKDISQTTLADITAIEQFTGKTLSSKIKLHLYSSMEIKTLMQDDANQANIDFEGNNIHTVIGKEYKNMYSEAPARLSLRNTLGEPKIEALETGLAVYFTHNWQGTDYNMQLKCLLDAELLPSISNLINNATYNEKSEYLNAIVCAGFINFLIEHYGKTYLLEHYLQWDSNSTELIVLDIEWHTFIKNTSSQNKNSSPPLPENTFLKGFNFAHEGYEVYNGYMGSESDMSIKELQNMGVNSLTLIPYSGFSSMTEPSPFRFSNSSGAENDASIIHAAYTAHKSGMSVMLKPQLWSHLGWTGDITMQSEKDWNLFFNYYEQWIIHYALIAELYDMEMFCIGVEFQNASLSEHNKWDALFDKVRKIYSGKITYAANWGTEFETVSFWNKLDFISVNCYYPLSKKTNPTDEELLTGFEKNLDVIEAVQKKYDMPVLFTEIGFKSIATPWINPHMDDDDQAYDEMAQKRCYSIMQQAMADEDWIKGVYIWKWPSYMSYSGKKNKDFTPCGKAAEDVIKDWFLK